MNSIKDAVASPLSSYSKTIIPDDEDIHSAWNFSVSSEPVTRKKLRESSLSESGRKSNFFSEDSINLAKASLHTSEPLVLIPEKDWKNTLTCGVCSIIFDKLKGVFTHHCRICGISVCGECSNKKLNNYRVCDVCFFRVESKDIIERREKVLEMKEVTLLDIESCIVDIKGRIEHFLNEISDIRRVLTEDKEKHQNTVRDLTSELRDLANICKKRQESKKNFEQNLRNEEILENAKRLDLERIRKETAKMKEENVRKMFSLNHGKEELKELVEHIQKTQTTQSYLDLSEVFEISKEDLQRTFTNIDFHSPLKAEQSMLENYELDVPNLLKKTISYQKRTYASHSLLKSKLATLNNGRHESQQVELENEEKNVLDEEQKPLKANGDCFGDKCRIF